jgi:hypothetical protein
MGRDLEFEAKVVAKYAAIELVLDERGRRLWAAAESLSIGYGVDALVSDATGISRPTIGSGRRQLATGAYERTRVRRRGGGRRRLEVSQPGEADRGVGKEHVGRNSEAYCAACPHVAACLPARASG